MRVVFILFFLFGFLSISFAQDSASQALRSQDILQEEKELREKIEEPIKSLIEDIAVNGVALLSEEEIDGIIAPFKGRWLSEDNFRQIVEIFKQAYQDIGSIAEISYQIKEGNLIINVEEQE